MTEEQEIAELIGEIGWTNRTVAARVGCNPATVDNWCNGARQIPREILRWLEGIARYLRAHEPPDYQALRPASGRPANAKETT